MRFLSIIKSAERGLTPPEALITAIGKMIQTSLQDGSLVQTGGLAGSAKGVRFRIAGKKLTVTDGPFAEAKEVIGGYAVLEAPTREAAIAYTKAFMQLHQEHWPEWEGECELRPIDFLAP